MRKRIDSGLWEIFVPELAAERSTNSRSSAPTAALLPLKADPFGFAAELRPSTASVVADSADFTWTDAEYLRQRARTAIRAASRCRSTRCISAPGGAARTAVPDLRRTGRAADPLRRRLGFTHLELLPVTEHPLDASWGYQPIGLFAPTRRFGDPAGFARFVDRAHAAGLGVILDWVPAHFPTDVHGLARFDGTALYEHADPRQGFHPDWNTAIYDFGRREVANFLLASALYWLDRFHIDGLRVDAVASMLYLDYSRQPGEWVPNPDGGNDNRDAVALPAPRQRARLRRAIPAPSRSPRNRPPGPACRGRPMPAASASASNGTWAGCTTRWTTWRQDPVHRRWHHDKLTFGLLYAFSENFVLPLSHDEVVHGKGSILGKMPGDEWQRFANVRAYYGFMWGHPGKKLLFMGQEFGQTSEWNFAGRSTGICWTIAPHRGVQALRARPQPAVSRDARRCMRATASPKASAGSSSTTRRSRCSPGCAVARGAIRRWRSSAISPRCRATATGSACRCRALARGR